MKWLDYLQYIIKCFLSVEINECLANACVNGSCVDLIGEYECDCFGGFIGEFCDQIDECFVQPCVNGTCNDLDLDFECDCFPGYEGKRCDVGQCK